MRKGSQFEVRGGAEVVSLRAVRADDPPPATIDFGPAPGSRPMYSHHPAEQTKARARSLSWTVLSEMMTGFGVYLLLAPKGALWSSLAFSFDISRMNKGRAQWHTCLTTITSRAFTFDRGSDGILGYIAIL